MELGWHLVDGRRLNMGILLSQGVLQGKQGIFQPVRLYPKKSRQRVYDRLKVWRPSGCLLLAGCPVGQLWLWTLSHHLLVQLLQWPSKLDSNAQKLNGRLRKIGEHLTRSHIIWQRRTFVVNGRTDEQGNSRSIKHKQARLQPSTYVHDLNCPKLERDRQIRPTLQVSPSPFEDPWKTNEALQLPIK